MLAVVDDFTREYVALVADTSLSGARVGRELDTVIARRGRPFTIVMSMARGISPLVAAQFSPLGRAW